MSYWDDLKGHLQQEMDAAIDVDHDPVVAAEEHAAERDRLAAERAEPYIARHPQRAYPGGGSY